MKDNETEFANQDEEISYKGMWKRLKGGVWSQMKANENNAVDGSYHDALEDVLAFICEMEEENGK